MRQGGLKTALLIALPLGLVIGLFLAGVGTAIWPPVSSWAAR